MSADAPSGARALVLHARRGLRLARAGESALAAASAGVLALWAVVVSGGAPWRAASLGCAGLCALLGGLCWWRAHLLGEARVAQLVDRAFGLDGALRTACEAERDGRAPRLGPLLTRRVCARVDRRAALRAVLPRSGPLMALPFLAAALFATALEGARRPGVADSLPALTGRLRAELAGLAESRGEPAPALSQAELAELFELARQAGELESARRRGALGPEELAAGLAGLQERLAALEAELPAESSLARRLEAVESTLDSARLATRAAGGTGASSPAAGVEGAAGGARAAGELTSPAPDGTMSRLDPPETAATAPGAGYAGGRWWPAEEDGLVARWIELRRAAAGER